MLRQPQDTPAKLVDFLDRVQGLLGQGWFYKGSFPGRDQGECRTTECVDLLALLAELVGDIQRFSEACAAFLEEGRNLGLSDGELRSLVGLDLGKLSLAHYRLATSLSDAGNRAVDVIGDAKS